MTKITKLQQWNLDNEGFWNHQYGNLIFLDDKLYIITEVWIAKKQIHLSAKVAEPKQPCSMNRYTPLAIIVEGIEKLTIWLTFITPTTATLYTNRVRIITEKIIKVMPKFRD